MQTTIETTKTTTTAVQSLCPTQIANNIGIATLVKEIRASQKGKMTTGNVHWDGPLKQWFVMVKDKDTPTFPNNTNWGLGWGWGLYKIDNPKKNISTDYKTDCMPCHVPARQTDWVYTQGYPTLFEKEGPFKQYPNESYEGK